MEDMVSHFTCRMLYCYETANHAKFVDMEKLVLRIKLERRLTGEVKEKYRLMDTLKQLVAYFLDRKVDDFHVSAQDWEEYRHKIIHHKD